jgi:hypothetical protein
LASSSATASGINTRSKKYSENLNLTYKNEIAKRSCIGNNDHL